MAQGELAELPGQLHARYAAHMAAALRSHHIDGPIHLSAADAQADGTAAGLRKDAAAHGQADGYVSFATPIDTPYRPGTVP